MLRKMRLLLWALGFFSLVFSSTTSMAQEMITVKGTVVDKVQKTPLAGATVKQMGGKGLTTVADANGNFEMAVPQNSKLALTMTGYQPLVVNANSRQLQIEMETASNDMEDIVVVGYTTQKKELLTGSVAQVKFKQADVEVPSTSAGNLLAGKMAGVYVSTPNGLPGAQPSISIRTGSSWNAAPVLYVIDGKVSGGGDFNNLSPNEIDNVTVLKDAATTAAYGARAAGGVVLVTTKRGSSQKTTISYSVNTGYDKRGKNMDLTSVLEWGSIYARIWGYGVGGPAGCPWTPADSVYFAAHDFGGGYGYGFNLLNDVYRNPMTTTHNLSVSGGSDKIKYYVGGSYVNQEAFIKNTGFKKYNMRANITADLNRDFSLFAGLSLNNNQTSAPVGDLGGDIYSKLLVWQPYMPSYTSKGLPVDYFWISNKSGEADGLAGYNKSENIKPVINVALTYKAPFLKGLSAKASFMKSYANYQNKIFTHPFTYYQLAQISPVVWDLDKIVGSRSTAHTPSLEQYASWSQDKQLDLQLSYDRHFGGHHVSGTVVYEGAEASGSGIDGWIYGFPLYTTDQWWAATSAGIVNNSPMKGVSNSYGVGYLTGRKSWVGQFFYDFASKYMVNFTYRYDGSMNFSPENRWGFFPSGSAGWVISKEKFFHVKGIDMLKLRASVGLTGNDNVGGWQWQDSYKAGSSAFFGTTPTLSPGIQYSGVPNPDITWEKYLNKNIGIDIAFLRNFNATIEYWNTNTYDILGARIQTTPPTFSLPLPAVNYGEEKAHGIDLSLNYNNHFGSVNFNVGVVGSYGYAWYVTRDQNITYDYQNMIGNGRTTTMVTGYEVDHMIRTQADLDAWNASHPGYKFNGYPAQLGQMVYKDLGSKNGMKIGDSVINGYDIAVLKNRNNPIVVGFNLGAEWKGFSLAATFNGSFNYLKSFNDVTGGVEWNRIWQAWYDKSWTPANPEAWLPKRYSANDATRTVNNSGSNFWLADGSFLRLKTLNIAYTIPTNLYKKYISSIRLYASGANLFVISKFNKTYYDPEMGSGVAFPIVKSYNVGCTVTF